MRRDRRTLDVPHSLKGSWSRNPAKNRGEEQRASWSSPGSWLRRQAPKGRNTERFRMAEVMWQESDAAVWNTLAHELETALECLSAEEEHDENIVMPSDERCDESEGEKQAPMEDEEQRDGSVAEHEGQSKQDLERMKKALMKLHTNMGHPGVKEMVRVMKHVVRRSWQYKRHDECVVMSVLKTCNESFPDWRSLAKCWTSNERLGLDMLSLPHWESFTKSVNFLNIVCHGTLFQMILPLWSGTTALDLRQAYQQVGSGGHVIRRKWSFIRLARTCTTFCWILWR